MAESSSAQGATPYAAATESLRAAAKWLLAAAAGVAGLLVAGLQLGSLGHLTSDDVIRLVIALLGLAIALVGVAVVIQSAGALLGDEWLTLGQLSSADFQARLNTPGPRREVAAAIYTEVESYREELYGGIATSMGDLYAVLARTNEQLRSNNGIDTDPQVIARAAEVRAAVKNVVDYANYRRTRVRFDALRRALGWGGIAVVVGLVIFAVASNPLERGGRTPGESAPATSTTPAVTLLPPGRASTVRNQPRYGFRRQQSSPARVSRVRLYFPISSPLETADSGFRRSYNTIVLFPNKWKMSRFDPSR